MASDLASSVQLLRRKSFAVLVYIIELYEAATLLVRSCETGEKNSDGTPRGIRVPDKHNIDAVRQALKSLEQ